MDTVAAILAALSVLVLLGTRLRRGRWARSKEEGPGFIVAAAILVLLFAGYHLLIAWVLDPSPPFPHVQTPATTQVRSDLERKLLARLRQAETAHRFIVTDRGREAFHERTARMSPSAIRLGLRQAEKEKMRLLFRQDLLYGLQLRLRRDIGARTDPLMTAEEIGESLRSAEAIMSEAKDTKGIPSDVAP